MGLAKIEQLISQLDYNWYNQKKFYFSKETFFDPKNDKIYGALPGGLEWDEESKSPIESPPIIVDVDFNEYCWSSYYPGCLDDNEYSNEVYPIDSNDVVGNILAEVKQMILQVKTDEFKYNIIMQTRDTIIEKVEFLQTQQPDDDRYKEILIDFLQRARTAIHEEYRTFKDAYKAAKKYSDRLVFDLKQDELAALLHILFKADFFHQNDPKFLEFCRNYFHFQNQRKGGLHTVAKGIVKKFSEARGEDYPPKARKTVIDRLQKAIREL